MSNGFFLVHRSLLNDWKWHPRYRGAWIWILAETRYGEHKGLQRGQCWFSVTWAPKEWGMTESAARRFLRRCENEKDEQGNPDPCIVWSRGRGGKKSGGQSDAQSDGQCDGQLGLITVLNYDEYQRQTNRLDGQSGGQSDAQSDGSYKERTKERTKEEDCTLRSQKAREESAKKAEEAMRSLDLEAFKTKYPHLNIPLEHENFINHHLAIPKNYHGAKKYTDWNRVFHTWCNQEWKRPENQRQKFQPVDNSNPPRPKTAQELNKDEVANQEKEAAIRANTLAAIERLPPPDRADLERRALALAEKSAKRMRRKVTQDLIDAAKIELYQQDRNGGRGQINSDRFSGSPHHNHSEVKKNDVSRGDLSSREN